MKEAEHLPPFPFHAFVFIVNGYAGVSVQYCVTDLAQAVHSCVTLCETVEADKSHRPSQNFSCMLHAELTQHCSP